MAALKAYFKDRLNYQELWDQQRMNDTILLCKKKLSFLLVSNVILTRVQSVLPIESFW